MVTLLIAALALQPAPAMLRSLFEQEFARVAALYGPTDRRTAQAARDLGLFLTRQDDLPAARAALARAVSANETALGPSAPETLACVADLAAVSEPVEAEPLWLRAAASTDSTVAARALGSLGALYERAGDRGAAIRFYRQAVAREETAATGNSDRLAARMNTLALLLDARDAVPLLERAHVLAARLGRRRVEAASIQINLAARLAASGRRPAALRHATEAISIFDETLGPDHPRTVAAHDYLRRLTGVKGSESR